MSLIGPIAEWLERHAGKHGVTGSIPGSSIYFHFEFFANFTLLMQLHVAHAQLGEAYINEIKHDIHPDHLR